MIFFIIVKLLCVNTGFILLSPDAYMYRFSLFRKLSTLVFGLLQFFRPHQRRGELQLLHIH